MFSLCNKQVDTTYVSTLPIWYIVIHSVVPFTKRLEIYTRKGQSKVFFSLIDSTGQHYLDEHLLNFFSEKNVPIG